MTHSTFDSDLFKAVCDHNRAAMRLQTAADTLEWDERTGMPSEAGEYRAEQVSSLRAAVHRQRTDQVYADRVWELQQQLPSLAPESDEAATIRGLARDLMHDQKLSTELVEALSVATVRGQQTWDAARKANRYDQFEPALANILRLKREAGHCLAEGTDRSIYEALLDDYEPDAREDDLGRVFEELRSPLVELIQTLNESPQHPNVSILERHFAVDRQRELSHQTAAAIGFDFMRGRLDETSHPFCTTLGPNDCRILTRFDSNWLPGGLYGTLHEAGHGMYEQGLRREWFGLPPGSYVSLGMHESQSRLWENQVGRSLAFSEWLFPTLQAMFPESLSGVKATEFYRAVNTVRPSLIRVEADEATYNLHIIIRFELERQLINGTLSTEELPDAWNDRYASDLGIRPPSDADGVLQDVHWSAGLIGYFPTYTLGNLASAQLFDAAKRELGDLDAEFARGDFAPLLMWLRQKVHIRGRCASGGELIEQATGEPLSASALVGYLRAKLLAVYAS